MDLSFQEYVAGFGVSLAVGAMVGLERERKSLTDKRPSFGGVRTFPLISLAGSLASVLGQKFGAFGFAAPLVLLGSLLVSAYLKEPRSEESPRLGLTSEIAALCVFVVGALPFIEIGALGYWDRLLLAGALGAIVMGILALREPLHELASRVSREDLFATLQFLLLASVALPLLPDEARDPWEAINPFKTGVFIVLIAGISFVGYVAVRVLGPKRGIGVTAAFGGLVSSTAVTFTFSQRAREMPALTRLCAFAITLAGTIMFGRLLVLIGAADPALLRPAALPISVMLGIGLVGCGALYLFSGVSREKKSETRVEPKLNNPFSLKGAVKLGVVYVLVRLLGAIATQQFGDAGLYVSALVAGITDVDAIALTIARLHDQGQTGTDAAVLAVVLAAFSNTVAKTIFAFVLGGRQLGLLVMAVYIPAAAGGLLAALLL